MSEPLADSDWQNLSVQDQLHHKHVQPHTKLSSSNFNWQRTKMMKCSQIGIAALILGLRSY
ncbi:hypothetical protein MJO28_004792 [Puccinia striiformis f. sp. tritici]|uniref:Uncharacterized protein n=3 Tax=Puccinia striiformis f. sp. tritici TaxID=168172 RepID=A0ACC0EI07_9BASI|nr:hypothetical protein MJO28_006199 [Puccinia striiformis f. sp. tritici]KAI7953959.1 hypothetical protein MJO28_006506 [Puccinia striiformis f. sp. tritici]KAI7954392.1 hypothetical protein MJO28_004792 [Puccinia striiformis f. sp. tritici]